MEESQHEKSLRLLSEFMDSDEGKAYFEKENQKHEFQLHRFEHFEEWLKHNDFDKLLYRVVLKHDANYIAKCWHNGCEPYPNNVLTFIIDYVTNTNETVNVQELRCKFSNDIWYFKGYYFQMIYGQGVITRIYNREDMRLILEI
jgi:hypothetical protein